MLKTLEQVIRNGVGTFMQDAFDLVIIGSGPAGRRAAIQAAKLDKRVLVVEKSKRVGGVSVHSGTIPSKTLRETVLNLSGWRERGFYGRTYKVKNDITADDLKHRLSQTLNHEVDVLEHQFSRNGVTLVTGHARFLSRSEIEIEQPNGHRVTYRFDKALISVGTKPYRPDTIPFDGTHILDSDEILNIPSLPRSLTVIGAGVIGLELGSVYARLGSEVTVVEFLDVITPGMDAEVQKTFQRTLKKQGLSFIMGAAVQKTEATKTKAKVHYKLRKDDSEHVLDADVVLVATGRKPYTEGLGLDALDVKMTERGQIAVNAKWETNVPGIYAIGDVIEGPMLAHKAEDEGMAAAEQVAGKHGHVNYGVIPGVIYTHPEVANVGASEEDLKDQGRTYKVGKFSFMGNGRAKANFAADGFVKILADKDTDRILGAHIIGPAAGDLIHEICVAMEFGASAEDLAMTCHAHPTYSEAVREAALACGDGPIHM